jgi:hypothetical protein
MKFSFEIATEPTIHLAVNITIVALSSTALAGISILLGNSSISIYCAAILMLIIWLVLIIHLPVTKAVRVSTAPTLLPPPLSTTKSKLLT